MANNYDPTAPIRKVDFGYERAAASSSDPAAPIRQAAFPHDWPKSSMTTTTVERIEQQARLQTQQPQPNRLAEFRMMDVGSGNVSQRGGK